MEKYGNKETQRKIHSYDITEVLTLEYVIRKYRNTKIRTFITLGAGVNVIELFYSIYIFIK